MWRRRRPAGVGSLDSARVFAAHVDAWQVHGRLLEAKGGGTAEYPGWRLMASGLPYSYLNAACVVDAAVADPAVARAWYESRNLDWGAIVPSGPAWRHGRRLLTQRLMASEPAGFSPARIPPGLVIRRAGPSDSEAVVAIDNGAFGSSQAAARAWLEPLCSFAEVQMALAELHGVPVAAGYATSCDGEAGPSLYIGGIGVLPPARRQGVASALLGWLLAPGFEAGASFAHLQTDSPDAARLYAKLGFRHFDGIDIYAVD